MSGLIKKAEATAAPVRSLSANPRPAPAPSREQRLIAGLRDEVEQLRETLQAQETEIAGHAKAVEDAFLAGEAAGRKAGLAQAEAHHEQALAALGRGVDQAVAGFKRDLEAVERLAGLLAMEGLAKVLGGEHGYADLVRATLAHHLAGISAASVVRVEVSPADFPDQTDLEALAASVGFPRLEVRTDAELAPGDCRIKLRLGALEVGIGRQWSRLQALLADTAQAAAS